MDRTHRRESQIVPIRNRRSNPPRVTSQPLPPRATSQPLPPRATQSLSKSPLSITNMFGNPDVKSEVLYRCVKNDYTILNKKALAEVKKKHDNIQGTFVKTSYTPELAREI